MRWDDAQVRSLLELEGLRQWVPGRTTGYAQLEKAVDEQAFYGADGRILCAALVLLAAGDLTPAAVARGHAAVQRLKLEMAAGRKNRLLHLGFDPDQAQRLADMHTRNFM